MTTPTGNLAPAAGLTRIRRKHRYLGGILIAYIPVVTLLYILRLPEWLILGTAIALILLGVVIAVIIGLALCPVCGKQFHVRGMGGSIFTRACMHCGARLNAEG